MSLLSIPREIRAEILKLVIYSPNDDDVPTENRAITLPNFSLGVITMPNPARALLLVNRQMNDETTYLLQYAPASYYVDIMYAKEQGIWTTWSIPALPRTQYIDSVYATMRISDHMESPTTPSGSLRYPPLLNDSSPVTFWPFYFMLSFLLRNGPGYNDATKAMGQSTCRYVVKNIVIDVLAPMDGCEHKSILVSNSEYTGELRQTGFDGHDDTSIPPEKRLAMYMVHWLKTLLKLDFRTFNLGCVIFENVQKRIEFLVNGKTYETFDIEKIAKNLDIQYWGRTEEYITERQEKYQIWKAWLEDRRKQMAKGLELDKDRPVKRVM